MKLTSSSFNGSKVVPINSQAVISMSLFNVSDQEQEVVVKILDELGGIKATIYQGKLGANKGYNDKLFANNGEKIEVMAKDAVGVNVGMLNENYIAKGILSTEYINCRGDGVKTEFSFNGITLTSFKELTIVFDGIYEAVFGEDYTLNADKSGVIFNTSVANGLNFVMLITKQE